MCYHIGEKSLGQGKNMTGKNTTQQPARASRLMDDWKFLFKWLFLLGALTAGITQVILYQPEFLISILMIVGIVVGMFYFDSDDVVNIGLRYLIFGTVVGAIETLRFVGTYITDFLLGIRFYLGPIVLTVVVMYFVRKYILSR